MATTNLYANNVVASEQIVSTLTQGSPLPGLVSQNSLYVEGFSRVGPVQCSGGFRNDKWATFGGEATFESSLKVKGEVSLRVPVIDVSASILLTQEQSNSLLWVKGSTLTITLPEAPLSGTKFTVVLTVNAGILPGTTIAANTGDTIGLNPDSGGYITGTVIRNQPSLSTSVPNTVTLVYISSESQWVVLETSVSWLASSP